MPCFARLVLLAALAVVPWGALAATEPGPVPATLTEKRVALVIGNAAYAGSPLRNPVNDARAMAKALRELGFEVIEHADVGKATFRRAVRDFGDSLRTKSVGLFYYAGHGVQVDGRNYLVPVGADIQREDEIADEAVEVNSVLQKMASARNRTNLVILDACRNNPFARTWRSVTTGLAPMDAPPGTLVAFATAPGQVASDGDRDFGLYTENLLREIVVPGARIEDVFKRVRASVRQASMGRQVPWENTSLEADFYFRPAEARAAASPEEIQRAVQVALADSRQEAARERGKMEEEMNRRIAAIEQSAREAVERALRERATTVAVREPQAAAPPPAKAPAQGPPAKPLGPLQAAPPPSPATVVALAAPALPSSLPATDAVARGVAPPAYALGDSWTYVRTDKASVAPTQETVTFTVTAEQPGRIELSADDGEVIVLDGRGGERGGRTRLGLEVSHDPPKQDLAFPLEAGKTWRVRYSGTKDSWPADYDLGATVLGWERVRVPAGEFDALKIAIVGGVSWLGGPKRRQSYSKVARTVWYAPQVRAAVRVEHLEGSAQGGGVSSLNARDEVSVLQAWSGGAGRAPR